MNLIKEKLRTHKTTLIIIAFITISLIVLKYDKKQITLNLMSLGLIGLLCVAFAVRAKSSRAKLILAYVSVLPLCLFIGEIYAFFYLSIVAKR